MSQQQILTAALGGLGTFKSAGGALADSGILTVLGLSKFPVGFYGALDIKVVTGPFYVENDGTAADANALQLNTGETWSIRNCNEMAALLRFFAAAAYDVRIVLYKGGTP